MPFVFILIGLVVGAGAAAAFFILREKNAERNLANAEEEARQILNDAIKSAESKKREALVEAKEEIHRRRSEYEREEKQRRAEVQKQERRLQQKEETLDRKTDALEKKSDTLSGKIAAVEAQQAEVALIKKSQLEMLEKISGFTVEEAKAYIIATAIQRCAADHTSEITVSVVPLPNDEMKGRIIGREGRNIRSIETLTGCDLIIDDTPEAITVSSFDPVRREVARLALEKLIQDGRIHPARIEEMVAKAQREVNATIKAEGERAVFETNIHGLNPEIIKLLGRMRYRTSYGQNVLNHSIEVSHIAGLMAAELGVDVNTAKRAGLLHDIGKAIDHEVEGSHVTIGVDLARKYKESDAVIHAIEAHHNDVEPRTVVACLVQAADAISASRPGARRENIENYVKRLEKLEEVSKSFPGIASSYAIQAGREIRIMVKPDEVSEDQMVLLARDIAKKIEEELTYPGQIKVHVLRETKAVDYAK